jgi:hypothetical protein
MRESTPTNATPKTTKTINNQDALALPACIKFVIACIPRGKDKLITENL